MSKRYIVLISKNDVSNKPIIIGISKTYDSYNEASVFATRLTYGSQVATIVDEELADKLIPRRFDNQQGV